MNEYLSTGLGSTKFSLVFRPSPLPFLVLVQKTTELVADCDAVMDRELHFALSVFFTAPLPKGAAGEEGKQSSQCWQGLAAQGVL